MLTDDQIDRVIAHIAAAEAAMDHGALGALVRVQHTQTTPLAYRSLDHEWGTDLQTMWHAARDLHAAAMTLDGITMPQGVPSSPRMAVADAAYAAWASLEEMAAPALRSFDAAEA